MDFRSSSRGLLVLQKIGFLRFTNFILWLSSLSIRKNPRLLGIPVPTHNQWISYKKLTSEHKKNSQILDSPFPKPDYPEVTVVITTFQAEMYLDKFIDNLLQQSYLKYCEVVLIACAPSQKERTILKSRLGDLGMVRVIELEERISIYEAWNMAIRLSSAPYITNMNVDDLRHPQSIQIQVSEAVDSSADVVWQDFYLSLDHSSSWEQIVEIGIKSNLPEVTLPRLARGQNAPHNAPLWRRSLHETIGYFDETFRSGADHDFWIRAAVAGAKFHKSKFAHVGYYLNPYGMSTKKDSPGRKEALVILHKYRKHA